MGVTDSTSRSQAASRHSGRRRRRRRLGIRIDMTPMVDVAFLLLTFFILTTVFSRPQTLEVGIPEDQTRVQVAEDNLMTIRVAADGALFWSLGRSRPQPVALDALGPVLTARNRANPRLVTVVKVDRQGRYEMAVDVLDELALAGITRFTIAPMLPEDLVLIRTARGE